MAQITVKHLGKAYRKYSSRWSRLAEWILPFGRSRHELKWVLKDLNFTVLPGEALGIIGINGAGKSTLLKLITGTSQPTTGSIKITGRVAALLELGMGFHPDFTGRQNIFMAGQLLGYTKEIITNLMPEIEAFSEIGEYIDQPVRIYSSGMQMRLAFSVATARRPDVLIVDEALSVGDAYFQHKSFDRIRAFREQGTTLLIVSHDKQAIQSICDRAILLNAGELAMEGEPEVVMDYYNAMLASHQNQSLKQEATANGKVQTVSGTGEARVLDIALLSNDGLPIKLVEVGQAVILRVVVGIKVALPQLIMGYLIKDRLGQPVFGTNTQLLGLQITHLTAGETVQFDMTFDVNLGRGNYSIAISLAGTGSHLAQNYEWRDLALIFEVTNFNREAFVGCAWLPTNVSFSRRAHE